MGPKSENIRDTDGNRGKPASIFSENTTALFDINNIINHPSLENKISQQTKSTCEEVVEDFFAKAKKLIYPLLCVIGILVGYVFQQSTNSINKLTESVLELTITIRGLQQNIDSIQRDVDKNHMDIEKLGDRVYRR